MHITASSSLKLVVAATAAGLTASLSTGALASSPNAACSEHATLGAGSSATSLCRMALETREEDQHHKQKGSDDVIPDTLRGLGLRSFEESTGGNSYDKDKRQIPGAVPSAPGQIANGIAQGGPVYILGESGGVIEAVTPQGVPVNIPIQPPIQPPVTGNAPWAAGGTLQMAQGDGSATANGASGSDGLPAPYAQVAGYPGQVQQVAGGVVGYTPLGAVAGGVSGVLPGQVAGLPGQVAGAPGQIVGVPGQIAGGANPFGVVGGVANGIPVAGGTAGGIVQGLPNPYSQVQGVAGGLPLGTVSGAAGSFLGGTPVGGAPGAAGSVLGGTPVGGIVGGLPLGAAQGEPGQDYEDFKSASLPYSPPPITATPSSTPMIDPGTPKTSLTSFLLAGTQAASRAPGAPAPFSSAPIQPSPPIQPPAHEEAHHPSPPISAPPAPVSAPAPPVSSAPVQPPVNGASALSGAPIPAPSAPAPPSGPPSAPVPVPAPGNVSAPTSSFRRFSRWVSSPLKRELDTSPSGGSGLPSGFPRPTAPIPGDKPPLLEAARRGAHAKDVSTSSNDDNSRIPSSSSIAPSGSAIMSQPSRRIFFRFIRQAQA